jgi:hypothetical protein
MVHRPVFLLAALCAALSLQAEPAPQPPCGSQPFPPYPEEIGSPVVKIWERSDWAPPPCIGWSASASATVVVTVARFRYSGGAEGLRRRIGAVSAMSGLPYWSTTQQKWQPLIIQAYALDGTDGERRREDFAPDEIAAGRSLAVRQEDNLLGKATYEMRIATAAAGRLVFGTGNRTTIRYFGLPLFQPGEIQSICFLDRESQDVWRYYNVTRMAKQASLLTMGHNASLINRAVAFYRYLAGIPAAQEPPAAR